MSLAPIAAIAVPRSRPAQAAPAPLNEVSTDTPASRARRFVASLPALLTALLFGAAIVTDVPRLDAISAGLLRSEFLVIHSFGFLGLLALMPVDGWRQHLLRGYVFFGLFGLYLRVAVDDDLDTALDLLLGTVATYGGLLVGAGNRPVRQVIRRWVVAFVAFCILAFAFLMPQNVRSWDNLYFGCAYFAFLAGAEMWGLYGRRWPAPR